MCVIRLAGRHETAVARGWQRGGECDSPVYVLAVGVRGHVRADDVDTGDDSVEDAVGAGEVDAVDEHGAGDGEVAVDVVAGWAGGARTWGRA